ncbi:template-activating factor I [Trypanosoma conorhini]|uniref:Template-activating factor I n=1 Tax=Trypanosoma conorhini TaxID=83891 RepID=A0A3R7PK46_9TRYP|nr:template-activating factor I [Trypanosoma conorhini]RNF26528.1 template-activating factor I [Trypanosoma conorhini]
MNTYPQQVIDADANCNDKVKTLQAETESEANQVRIDYRKKLERLFEQRQESLDKIEGFWSGVLAATDTPLKPLLNGTIDPKIVRAITSFKVTTFVKDGLLCRNVSVVLRPNMFAEQGTIHRAVDTHLQTLSMEPIKWKSGTERARQDSVFRFFTPGCDDEGFIDDALDAFDTVFQNPFLALEPNED